MATAAEQRESGYGDTRARAGDVGVPDDLERRYREQDDGRSIGDYMDDEYEAGRKAGQAEKPASGGSAASRASARLELRRPGAVPSVGAPMVVELALVTADEILTNRRPPLPSRLLVIFAVFGTLGLAKGPAAETAAVFGWGLVIATFYASTNPGQPAAPLRVLAGVGDFLSGKYGVAAPPVVASSGSSAAGGGGTYRKR